MLRMLVTERMDPVLFGYSYDYVGDLAETVSLVWPDPPADLASDHQPSLADVVGALQSASRSDGPAVLAQLLDAAGISARYAIIKLVTGGLRIGVSARLAKQALAELGEVDVAEIEEVWHGLTQPYLSLFAWLEGNAPRPEKAAAPSSVPLCCRIRWKTVTCTSRPNGLRRRMEMGWHSCSGGLRGRPAEALLAHGRRDFRRFSRPYRGDGLRWCAGRRTAGGQSRPLTPARSPIFSSG